MATVDRDIWAKANLYLTRYGDRADIFAAMRAKEMLESHDHAAADTWMQVRRALVALQRRQHGEVMN